MQNISQVVVPRVYPEFTSRRVHVAEWIEGIKLSQSDSDDVEELVAVGMIAYLTQVTPTLSLSPSLPSLTSCLYPRLLALACLTYLQLLESGFFHADPHPGNMLRTPDGRLAILDFGLMTQVRRREREKERLTEEAIREGAGAGREQREGADESVAGYG
eukprot:749597-Hanusia_phi.AAC.8